MKNDVKFCHDLLILISFAFIQNQQLSLKLQNENYRGTDWIFICSTQKANKSYGFPITWGWFCLAFILLHFCFLSTSTLSSSLLRLLISNTLVFCNRSFSANSLSLAFCLAGRLLLWTLFLACGLGRFFCSSPQAAVLPLLEREFKHYELRAWKIKPSMTHTWSRIICSIMYVIYWESPV